MHLSGRGQQEAGCPPHLLHLEGVLHAEALRQVIQHLVSLPAEGGTSGTPSTSASFCSQRTSTSTLRFISPYSLKMSRSAPTLPAYLLRGAGALTCLWATPMWGVTECEDMHLDTSVCSGSLRCEQISCFHLMQAGRGMQWGWMLARPADQWL